MVLGFHFNEKTFVRNLKRGILLLIGFELLLAMVYFFNEASSEPIELIRSMIKLDGEGSLSSWFSAIQLFVIGLVFLSLSFHRREGQQPAPWFLRLGSLVFFFLSFDEGSGFHEKMTFFLQAQSWAPRIQDGRGIWIAAYVLLAVLLLVVSARELIRLFRFHPQGALWMGMGLGIYILGAAGLEALAYEIWQLESETLAYQLEVVFEETFEMVGVSLILYGLLLIGHRILAPQAAAQDHPEAETGAAELLDRKAISKEMG